MFTSWDGSSLSKYKLELIDQDILERIKSGDDRAVVAMYENYRKEFLYWSFNSFGLAPEDAADIFQDAVVIMYSNVRKGKLEALSCSVKTYLFGIAKNLALRKIHNKSRLVVNDELPDLSPQVDYEDPFEVSQRQKVMADTIDGMGDPCKSLLRLFYFDRFSMDSIAQRLGYKNEHVAKSQKLRCFNQLKKMISERFNIEDL